jgi:DNA-binding transcriptional ArsR family regulator
VTGSSCIVALKALAEETRLRMIRLLFREKLSVNEISERLGVSQYNVSKHLRIMREAGLVKAEKRGKHHLYAVAPELKSEVAESNSVLDLGCCAFRLDCLPK